MYHDISKLKQYIFATLFATFAVLGPFIAVNSSESFGIRANIAKKNNLVDNINHTEFFCSGWAGSCAEQRLKQKISVLLKES